MNEVKVEEEEGGDDCQQLPAEGSMMIPDPQSLSSAPEPAADQAKPKRRHRCSICDREFAGPSRLADHVATHYGYKPHSCSICGKRFTKKVNVLVHQRVHTGEKPYSCPDCGVSYAQRGCLRRHLLIHSPEKPFNCSLCGRGFVQRRYLVQHERTHTGEKPFSCSLCPKRFASRSGLSDHQKTHQEQKQHSCLLCGKTFTSASSFRDHVRNHTGRKLHPCSLCGRSFNRPSLLKKHMQKHADGTFEKEEASLRCLLCQEDFSSIKEAKEHEQRHHTTSRFACDICGRAFTRLSQLKDHMRSHTGERPFQCDVCKTRFTLLRALRKHQKIHSRQESRAHTTPGGGPERPATEPESEELLDDLKVENHGDETLPSMTDQSPIRTKDLHICSLCGEIFLDLSTLEDHLKTHEVAENLPLCSPSTDTLRTSSSPRASKTKRNHCCSICSRSFLKPCLLREHMMVHIREGQLADPADKEFWLHMRTGGQKKRVMKEVEEEGANKQFFCQQSGDPSTSDNLLLSELRPLAGNHGDQGGRSSEENKCEQHEEEDVSGLINSDGEEERWEPERHDPKSRSDPLTDSSSGEKTRNCCPVCGRDCFKASALQKHLRIHSGERPFQCPTCRKSFVQLVHMTEHQRIHTGEKPFTCTICSKSFTFSSALRRHQRVHTDARPFQCSVCPKTFKQLCVLKNHQLTHTGVRYQCPLCSKSFSRALELTYHIDVHSDKNPYFCSICKKNLSGARIFRKHMRKHESDKPQMGAATMEAEVELAETV
ncbi:hypothetical protein ATANTOWER_007709 [Ataeniobius toweri]|uniref:C2H2-type domain-containing protein n=1 Tax=Ataeniobius toweri TaxID=208326 RepID=A0ABU7AQ34_9TELE|nr:hypothetical protein [Ataeniobius toweri]